MGGMLGPRMLTSGFSPSLLAAHDHGLGPIRATVGAVTAPTFGWVAADETAGIALAMFDVGVSVGDERFRAGVFATGGFLAAGLGIRAVVTPFDAPGGHRRGFEARLTWFTPRSGAMGLYYVQTVRGTGQRTREVSRPRRGGFCARFTVGFGAAATASSTERSWEFVGSDEPFQLTGSPALVVACEQGGRTGGWHVGAETAPWAFHRVPTDDGGADRKLHHMGSMTAGAYLGAGAARVGVIGTAGVWTLGGGVRAVLSPFAARDGSRHGLELRALALVPSAPAVEAMALYHLWFDPR